MKADFTKTTLLEMEYERQRQAPPDDFPRLPLIPGARYIDPEFQQLEWEWLWKKSWLYACHLDEIPEQGSYLLWRKTRSPIILVRGEGKEVRAFYNTCRHRGGPLIKEEKGKLDGGFVCRYHGWCYNLHGQLTAIREKRDFVDFDVSAHSLTSVKCEGIGNWVFINEDTLAEPLLGHIQPIPDHLQQFQPDNIRLVHSKSYEVNCNVKILLDAFFEVYHLSSIHQHTVDRFLDYRGTVIKLWPLGHSTMITPNRNPDWVDPGTISMAKIDTVTEIPAQHNMSLHFYPNLVAPMADSGMPFLTFWPMEINTMQIDCHWFAPDWGEGDYDPLWEKRIENFERILGEDTQFAAQIQESVESPGFEGITLNYQERRIYHWHEELDRRIGLERIPQHLRVKPLLKSYIEKSE
jgi:phenylpropionate dioxygenase-like ring-hydroxylating dioxygenase large terminal subunit